MTMATTTLDGMLAATVTADPADRTVWLILADALDEAGRGREATLIRSGKPVVIRDGIVRRPARRKAHFDLDQGVSGSGRVFGFDFMRNNFVEWDLDGEGNIYVAAVENDEMSDRHGSLSATRRDAERIARRENRMERRGAESGYGGSHLHAAICREKRAQHRGRYDD
jgi:uncharacterized protein (TIGR02996 family)